MASTQSRSKAPRALALAIAVALAVATVTALTGITEAHAPAHDQDQKHQEGHVHGHEHNHDHDRGRHDHHDHDHHAHVHHAHGDHAHGRNQDAHDGHGHDHDDRQTHEHEGHDQHRHGPDDHSHHESDYGSHTNEYRKLKDYAGPNHDHAHSNELDHAHDHADEHAMKAVDPKINRFSPSVWAEALFATALVGAAPVVVLLFVPLGVGNPDAQKPLLRVFLSFAAGGLLGDSLLHLLPHSMPAHNHDHGHTHDHEHGHGHSHDHGHESHAHSVEDLAVWLWTIAGMITFLMLEKFVRAQTGGGHSHSHGVATDCSTKAHAHGHARGAAKGANDRDGTTTRKRTKAHKAKYSDDEDHEDDTSSAPTADQLDYQPIAAAGYLNLAADFTHNFTDGLAIGATFLRGSGWQTTLAMLLHELPHEIGDFAILIQSGFTRREAMLTQLLTAIGAMLGTVIGLLMEGAGDSSSAWISPFTAGGFIYIACASVMPELLEDCSLAQSLKEGVAMCLGIGLMVLIALNE